MVHRNYLGGAHFCFLLGFFGGADRLDWWVSYKYLAISLLIEIHVSSIASTREYLQWIYWNFRA